MSWWIMCLQGHFHWFTEQKATSPNRLYRLGLWLFIMKFSRIDKNYSEQDTFWQQEDV